MIKLILHAKLLLVVFAAHFVFSCGGSDAIPDAHVSLLTPTVLQKYPTILFVDLKSGINSNDFDFHWDFGDSTVGAGDQVEHSYELPGTYNITLTITGSEDESKGTRTIEVLPSLELVSSYSVDVNSPSGLAFGANQQTLWTVSDKPNGRVFELDLMGQKLRELTYSGDDLEGICYDKRDGSLWLVDESSRELIHIDTTGMVIEKTSIPGISDGSGLEGISIDYTTPRIFLLKEKDFGALITLNESLETQVFQRIGFAPDFSALSFDNESGDLWVMSHEASSIYKLNNAGSVTETYGFVMNQPEGLVVHGTAGLFYIIDDTTEKLNIYRHW